MLLNLRNILSSLSIITILLLSPQANAQEAVCLPMDQMYRYLQEGYNELPISFGLNKNGSLLQIFSSENGETWTAVVIRPNRIGCIVAAGTDWIQQEYRDREEGPRA